MANPNFLEMSDEDFVKQSPPDPPDNKEAEKAEDQKPEEPEAPKPEGQPKTPVESPRKAVEGDSDDGPTDGSPKLSPAVEALKGKPGTKREDPKPSTAPDAGPDSVNYEGFYKQIMTPFKANGREIKLNTPDEAIRLMQMGAGYGRKLQEIQPHLKTLKMLQNNNLLDENQLSYLIDLHQRKPDAIKKLFKDSGLDPLDFNADEEVNYRPTNRSISDSELAFSDALTEVQSLPKGRETIVEINNRWDEESKNLLFQKPELLGVIQSQYENGIYSQITAEIDRQKLLGLIPANTVFIQAYKTAGDYLFGDQATQPAQPNGQSPQRPLQAQPRVLATKAGNVRSQVSNSDKARAASPTQTTSRNAREITNPLQMADDDFLKQFKDRLG